jgi:hypothetical protein
MAAGGAPAWWLLVDMLVAAAVVAALGVGFLAIRRSRPNGTLTRAWAAGSIVVLLLLAVLIGLD